MPEYHPIIAEVGQCMHVCLSESANTPDIQLHYNIISPPCLFRDSLVQVNNAIGAAELFYLIILGLTKGSNLKICLHLL